MRSGHLPGSVTIVAALTVASCSSESVNATASSGGGAAGTGAGAATGGSGGTATGGNGGTATGGNASGGTGATTTGGAPGDAGMDAPSPCAFPADAGSFGKWPDSLTKWCAGTGCKGAGEDGDYVLNAPTYTVNGNVVKDGVTGLEWRKDVIETTTWAQAPSSCTALNQADAGGNLWRVPTRFELMSLLDFGSGSSFQPVAFDKPTGSNSFWTVNPVAANATLAWTVSFLTGAVGSSVKTASISVRCVRGTPPVSQLAANPSCDVVNDVGLGLMWQRTSNAAQYAWADALLHCESLTHAGLSDWRLPSAKELMTIVLDTAAKPAINTAVFSATPSESFWSSTPRRSDPTKSEVVDFSSGVEGFETASVPHRVRCVRSLP